ncbi:MAG: hypothetical protein QOH62_2114 [Solirubrobacteraceae bacterium]|jgi:NADPH:quinone reductase-like Zn-dependent oxidoreductase|nr:hypothetical protein [Solirubrobacteraceae bacterium]
MPISAFLPSGDDALVARTSIDSPAPAHHQALVAVEAYSVNRGEILLLAGGRTEPPGKDIAGRVAQAAADGSGPPAGTRVVAHIDGGGWAEQVAVEAGRLVALPDAVSAEQGAALPLAGLTALRLMRAAGDLDGRRLLLTGASGGVGHYVTELAVAAGARVTATSRTAERGARLAELGATVVENVEDADGPFDVAMESVGGAMTGAAALKLRRGGLLLWYGQGSGQPAELDFFAVMAGPAEVAIRSFVYWLEADRDPEDLATLVDLVAGGRLHPEIGDSADWSSTPRVLAAVRDRQVRGNAVLTLNGKR